MDLRERIRTALEHRQRIELPAGPVPAAVLLLLYRKDGEYHLLFTKRTERLNHHAGEISFPGGVCNPEEHSSSAALRETWEEVGVDPAQVEILGALDDCLSIHDYLVTPVVGYISNLLPLKINHAEIDKILEVPVAHLRDPSCFRVEEWGWRGRNYPVCFYRYGEDDIWGLTAAIVRQFLEIAYAQG
jgi:8-oxo-dGTP pyrophosphatase MutT (NUDIX family)